MYALRRENGDVLFFDAVTDLQEQYSSSVTKHPIATGGFISDHTIKDNKKFTLSCVLSDADFNLDRPSLAGASNGIQSIVDDDSGYDYNNPIESNARAGLWSRGKQYVNNTPTNTTVTIKSGVTETWKKFVPETVSQFTRDQIPQVTVTQQSKVKPAESVKAEMIAMWEEKERFTLLEYNDNIVTRYWPNVVFTNLSFAINADSGTGLFPVMSLEQVTYVDIEKVAIKIRRTPNKGRKVGDTSKKTSEDGDDAAKEPSKFSNKSSLQILRKTASEDKT